MFAHVFGYASLVAIKDAEAAPGRLHGYRRFWGAAMNNWEDGDTVKHWLDRETGERPRIRVAYLDIEPNEGSTVNGVAIPVDAERMAQLDAREINYRRVDITTDFEGSARGRVFAYMGLDAARKRCRQGAAEGNAFVSRDYFAGVRRAFQSLGDDALDEFDRTTDRLPFLERDLQVAYPSSATGS
ncbi:MAG TPA: gamma-glutamylcyclotransferase family protein [Solirubrobacterales bacterium]|nr:gamma-glutamylcyclotransferase family protein [Solirubrobacterales bacterium]